MQSTFENSLNRKFPGIETQQVLETFVRETDALVDLYVDGEVIYTTGEHPFWVPDKGWVEAKDLVVGSLLRTGMVGLLMSIGLRSGKGRLRLTILMLRVSRLTLSRSWGCWFIILVLGVEIQLEVIQEQIPLPERFSQYEFFHVHGKTQVPRDKIFTTKLRKKE